MKKPSFCAKIRGIFDAKMLEIWSQVLEIYAKFSLPQWVAIILGTPLVFFQGRFWMRYFYRRHEVDKLVHLRITLPKNDSKLDNEKRTEKDFHEQIGKAEQFFRTLHELRDLNLKNIVCKRMIWKKPHISFELQFEKRELFFCVVCDPYYQKILEKQITSIYPTADIEVVPKSDRLSLKKPGMFANGFFLYQKRPFWYPIKVYKQIEEDALNNVANCFSKLNEKEVGVIQLVVHPASDRWQKKAKEEGTKIFKNKTGKEFKVPILGPIFRLIWTPFRIVLNGYDPKTDGASNAPGAKGGDSYVRMLASEEEVAKAIGEKAHRSGFETVIRVFAMSESRARTQEILDGMFVAFNVFKDKGRNFFENRRIIPLNFINVPIILGHFKYRLGPFPLLERKSILSSEELATVFHFPDARYNKIPTIKWLSYKVLAPPINLPEDGIVLGNSVYRGMKKPVQVIRNDRTRHFYILGKSGSGKSVMLEYMAGQDVANGEGVCVVDPHGDLVEDVLARTPKHRAQEVLVFDPGDRERPMGLNILEAETEEQKDRASLDAMEIFIKLFGNEIFGPRIQHYFRNGCLTLMSDKSEGATLIDIPRLFIDDEFQKYKVAKVQNPVVRSFWENEMANTGDREKQEMIPYFTSKFGPFVTNTTMRNIIGQTKSAFNIREAMDSQKVVLVNLSKGKIGGINAQLLGLIMVSKINQAAMARADMAKEDRKDFYLYVDEFQNFATDTFASILSEARKYRLNLIMAHQYIAQLSESAGGVAVGQKDSKIRDAVFGNVGSMASFKVGADDAEYLEKEYAPDLSQQDILSMANYKMYMKLNINNSTSRPFSVESIWDPDGRNYKIGAVIKKYSRIKHGRKKEFVDAEIEARMGIDNLSQISKNAAADPTVSDDLLDAKKSQKVDENPQPAIAKTAAISIPKTSQTMSKNAIAVPAPAAVVSSAPAPAPTKTPIPNSPAPAAPVIAAAA